MMKEIEIPEMVNFNLFVRDLRLLLAKYSPTLPMIQQALSLIFKKEKK